MAVAEFNPLDPEFIANPYPFYRALREQDRQIAIGTLVRRLPGLRLATDTVEWREASVLRGLKALPVHSA